MRTAGHPTLKGPAWGGVGGAGVGGTLGEPGCDEGGRYNAAMLQKSRNHAAILLVSTATFLLVGCGVQRTITVTSEPAGALVYLNDQEVGRTPVDVPFLFYGTYDVRLDKEGYRPLWTSANAKAPWWETIGPDLVAEAVGAESKIAWHFTLEPLPTEDGVVTADVDALVARAEQLRSQLGAPSAGGEADVDAADQEKAAP